MHFRWLCLAAFLVFVAPSPQAQGHGGALPATIKPAILSADLIPKRVDDFIQPYVDRRDFAGAVLVARDGKVLLRKAYGEASVELHVPNSPTTVFHVGSINKSFTAAAILRLEELGVLRVTDPVSRLLPSYPRGSEITIHHLLTHRSGILNYNLLPDYDAVVQRRLTLEETVAWFKDKPLRSEPGAQYHYSNSGYALLANIIETATGKSYEQVLDELILKPAGLKTTGIVPEEQIVLGRAAGYEPGPGDRGLRNTKPYDRSVKRGSGALWSTVDDLYRYEQSFYGSQVLTEASRRKMFTAHYPADRYGYGWIVDTFLGRPRIAHDGKAPGFVAEIIRFPEERLSIIFVGNIYSGVSHIFERDLSAIMFGQQPATPLPLPNRPLSVTVLDQYVGHYKFPPPSSLSFQVARSGDHLEVFFGSAGGGQYLTTESESQFLMRSRYDRLSFARDSSGRVSSVRYEELGFDVVTVCERVR